MKKYTLSNQEATKLLKDNMGLIKKVASKYTKASFTFDEVMSVAKESFLCAANNLDETKAKLSTYSVIAMTGNLMELKRKHWRHLYNKLSFDGERINHDITDICIHTGSEPMEYSTNDINSKNYNQEIEDKIYSNQLLNTLKPRQRQVLELRYFKDLDFMKIGDQLGVSHQRATQIHNEAIKQLQGIVNEKA